MLDTHAILIRPLATSRWEILEYATSAKSALEKASQPRDGLSHGDLILAIDIAEISAISELGKCLYFVDEAGKIKKAHEPPYKPTWFLEWEGPDAKANDMLRLCTNVDRKLMVTAVCAIARIALPYVPVDDDSARIAIEMAEAWVLGKAKKKQVKDAGDAAWVAANGREFAERAGVAAANAAHMLSSSSPTQDAAAAAYFTAIAMPGDYKDNIRQLSHIVREYIPLYVVLESRL